MKKTALIMVSLILAAIITGGSATTDESEYGELRAEIEEHAVEIIGKSCSVVGCHGGNKPAAELGLEKEKLSAMVGMPSTQLKGAMMVDAGSPNNSYFLMKVRGDKGIVGSKMPVWVDPLTGEEIKLLHLWVYSMSLDAESK